MPKKKQEPEVVQTVEVSKPSEKEVLLALHAELKSRGITRISDLEGQIARAE